ncbi:SIR2 family NAD-dependent protein deacylase [Candidatus Palauibacter sp.]|uniref:SIR2 family NAD-dependent protein deacylase n=1 Tax=Candidatus Palauibacter sp. TaxID=3101350 RepID=UPI003B01C6E9
MEQGQWRQARRLVREARRVVALTGAGISAESGVPTFRDAGGLWKSHRPEELATPEALARDPRTVLEWYAWRRSALAGCRPNEGHRALARFFLRRGEAGLVTQNVDGLHTRAALEEAGEDPAEAALPLELHGAVGRDRCESCEARWPAEPLGETLPRCSACGGLRRPDVVLFGETLDPDLLDRARRLAERADLCLVVGTSAVVYPAAALPLATRGAGGHIVEVNVQRTALTEVATLALLGEAGTVLPALLD